MNTLLINGLILGFASNLHCVGMCGPIAMAVPVNRSSFFSILSGVMQYNTGRIFTYAILGSIAGLIGISVNVIGILQGLSIISGVFLIIYAWRKWISVHINFHFQLPFGQQFISKNMGKVVRSQNPLKLFLFGTLNGLLPCGLVYLGLMNALLAGNPLESSYAMVFFGIGTLPAMLTVGFAANKITGSLRNKLSKAVPYLLTLVGLLIVLRGMNLGIPYVSPKMSVFVQDNHGKKESTVNMVCCHGGGTNSCEKSDNPNETKQ